MLKQPASVVRMTNVATIRYKINNRTFEIACYPSKVVNWRSGIEQDLSEVLQISEVYENASHGVVARKQDLARFFPDKTKLEVIRIILERGELQVSDKEREAQQSELFAEIIKIVVEKCVHPLTRRRFTPETIRQALKDIHFPIRPDQSAKKQALDAIKALQKIYLIDRAQMRLRITFPRLSQSLVEKQLQALGAVYPAEKCKNQHPESSFKQETKQTQNQLQKTQETDKMSKSVGQGNEQVVRQNKQCLAQEQMRQKIFDIESHRYRDAIQIKQIPGVLIDVLVGSVVNSEYHGLEDEQFSMLELREGQKKVEKEEQAPVIQTKLSQNKDKLLKCTTCGESASFPNQAEQRKHFKTQWHVENVRRKAKSEPPLTEETFKIQEFNRSYK